MVHIAGEITPATAPLLRDCVERRWRRCDRIVLDLLDVGRLGTAALTELAGLVADARRRGGELALVTRSPAAGHALAGYGTGGPVPRYPSVAAALGRDRAAAAE